MIIQLDLFIRPKICERLGVHVWAFNGYNNCECGRETIGPWNCPDHWTPGTPIKDRLAVVRKEKEAA